ncbi:MAG: hypothetical protein JWN21_2629 [Sphingomonas bacterium]|uniref:hypothetical protein n=1 Tax=Sphingomonas bacterium TaxID=1895847 RepID=UPI00263242CC|nr:hypothetical protein [Sphingomonas bacterium]MDB5697086.1 hypothetical protein [Sphingomonas bacterium]
MATQPLPESPTPDATPVEPGGPGPEITTPQPDFDQPSPGMPSTDPGTQQPPEMM